MPIKEGWVYRRRDYLDFTFAERYLLLRGSHLMVYKRKGEPSPRRVIVLTYDLDVGEVEEVRGTFHAAQLFTFRLGFREEGKENDDSDTEVASRTSSRLSSGGSFKNLFGLMGSTKEKDKKEEKDVPEIIMSDADKEREGEAGEGQATVQEGAEGSRKHGEVIRYFEFGCKTKEEATEWRDVIMHSRDQLRALEDKQLEDRRRLANPPEAKGIEEVPAQIQTLMEEALRTHTKVSEFRERQDDVSRLTMYSLDSELAAQQKFQLYTVADGITVYRDRNDGFFEHKMEYARAVNDMLIRAMAVGLLMSLVLALKGYIWLALVGGFATSFALIGGMLHSMPVKGPPSLMAVQLVRGEPEHITQILTKTNVMPAWMPAVARARDIEVVNEYSSIIHVVVNPTQVFPFWARPRDMVLMRYWRCEDDGSHLVMYTSTNHPSCPPSKDYVRASMPLMAVVVFPKKKEVQAVESTLPVSQVALGLTYNPGGVSALLSEHLQHIGPSLPFLRALISLKDECLLRDFVNPKLTFELPEGAPVRTSAPGVDSHGMVVGVQKVPSSCPQKFWGEPDASKFEVRGRNYLTDRAKCPAGPAMFHLVALDVLSFENADHRYNLALRPDNLVQSLNSNSSAPPPPFTFVVNIIVPTSDNLCVVCYYQPADPKWAESSVAGLDLFNKFIDGTDEFRNSRFKLVPDMVEGSFFIRKAVPCRPAIIGNKGLKMNYLRRPNFFEVDFDVSSDPTARSVTGLVLGATKTLAVDLAFLIESKSEAELPETILGTVRFDHIDLGVFKRIPKEAPTHVDEKVAGGS
eukprot:comp23727_c0_seq1/m.40905 comp23727_c0_seq1/g.40905  ORF comp23727_c0_seq1/g.40905 comp23727_c0_seq1/m.40905 type:complete len:803 (-) comp23727_c0_seq1:10-2418(-)